MSEQSGADVAVKVAGQEINIRNVKSLNTLATVATLILAILILYVIFEHKMDAKADGQTLAAIMKEQTSAIRDSTSAQREMNCLISLPQDRREREFGNENSLCKRLSRER